MMKTVKYKRAMFKVGCHWTVNLVLIDAGLNEIEQCNLTAYNITNLFQQIWKIEEKSSPGKCRLF